MFNLTNAQAGTIEYIAALNAALNGKAALTANQRANYRADRKEALATLPAKLRTVAPVADGWLAAHQWLNTQNITD